MHATQTQPDAEGVARESDNTPLLCMCSYSAHVCMCVGVFGP
jgi:hypothetical protein